MRPLRLLCLLSLAAALPGCVVADSGAVYGYSQPAYVPPPVVVVRPAPVYPRYYGPAYGYGRPYYVQPRAYGYGYGGPYRRW